MDAILQYNLAIFAVWIALVLIGILITWFVIYTAARAALRSDRERAERERYEGR